MGGRFEHSTDVAAGVWIAPRLGGEFGAVGLVCPTGFEAYARVFHPVGERRLRWSEVCAVTGRTAHPLMQWGRISGTLHGTRYFGGWEEGDPDQGTPDEGALDVDGLAALAHAIGGDTGITIGVWTGYGQYNPGSTSTVSFAYAAGDDGAGGTADEGAAASASASGPAASAGFEPTFDAGLPFRPTLDLPGREYGLFRGRLATLRDPGWREASGWAWRWSDTLNLAWPDDRSWFVASEIDFDSTVVGGSRALVDRVLASDLETAEVDQTSDLSWEGDLVNPSAPTA